MFVKYLELTSVTRNYQQGNCNSQRQLTQQNERNFVFHKAKSNQLAIKERINLYEKIHKYLTNNDIDNDKEEQVRNIMK